MTDGFRPGLGTIPSGQRLPDGIVAWSGYGLQYLSEDICAVITLHTRASCVTTVGMITDREGDIK